MKAMLLILALCLSTGCVTLPPMPMQTSNAPSTYATSSAIVMDDSCLVEGGE
jgi:starvation-inducible outer membrane lipoprotein